MTKTAIEQSAKVSSLWGTLLTFGGFLLVCGAFAFAYQELEKADAEYENLQVRYEAKGNLARQPSFSRRSLETRLNRLS